MGARIIGFTQTVLSYRYLSLPSNPTNKGWREITIGGTMARATLIRLLAGIGYSQSFPGI